MTEVETLLRGRNCGRRLVAGPWQQLSANRWGVPAVAYMSGQALPDTVVEQDRDGRWTWVKDKQTCGRENTDPLAGGLW